MNLYSITVGFAGSGEYGVTPVFLPGGPPRARHARGAGEFACGKCRTVHGQGVRRTSRGPDEGRRPPGELQLARAALHGHRGAGILAGQPELVAGVQSAARAARAQVLAGRGGRPDGRLRAPGGQRRRHLDAPPDRRLMPGPARFTHLHVASSYSLRYGTATPAALAARAASLGMPALALTDRDGLYGAFKHVQACADAGIKPLLGAELVLSGGATPRNPPLSRRAGPIAETAIVSGPPAGAGGPGAPPRPGGGGG